MNASIIVKKDSKEEWQVEQTSCSIFSNFCVALLSIRVFLSMNC